MRSNKVLFCATEAGGARNLVPIITAGYGSDSMIGVVGGFGSQEIFDNAGIQMISTEIGGISEVEKLLDEMLPKAVVLGRAINFDSTERLIIEAAKKRCIPSISIIDDWYDYRANYADESGHLSHLPNVVCCPDEQAFYEAIDDGVPKEVLRITGSPALCDLFDKKETIKQQLASSGRHFGTKLIRPVILFISEEIVSGQIHGKYGRQLVSSDIGYNQHSVRQDLVRVLSSVFNQCTVLERLHPEARKEDYSQIESDSIDWQILDKRDLHNLCLQSDVVVGMRSMGLFESAILGVATVSFQPNLVGVEQCTAVRKNLIEICYTSEELENWLSDYSSHEGSLVGRPRYACSNATACITSIIEDEINSLRC